MPSRSYRVVCRSYWSTPFPSLYTGVVSLDNTKSLSIQPPGNSNFGKNLRFILKFMAFGTKLEQLKLSQISQYIARNFLWNFSNHPR
jgi:hypothetical protein